MEKLLPGLKRAFRECSGIVHHMLFQRCVLEDLFQLVEQFHGKNFWEAFCHCVDYTHFSGASEYEIYFNFFLLRSFSLPYLRSLRWEGINNLKDLEGYKQRDFDFVHSHWTTRVEL